MHAGEGTDSRAPLQEFKEGGITDPLFSGTIESNLRYADQNAAPEALQEAAEIAQASEFIQSKPYDEFGKELDSIPVTDGQKSYWLMPLIIGFDTHDVPWSIGNPYLRLVGFALIDSYDGNIQLLKTGDDFFTEMFVSQYSNQFKPIPSWLEKQIRYPVELFNWKAEMYNIYHVNDVETFIQANEFYEIPQGLEAYYVEAKPPGFNQTEFIGLLS